ERLETPSRPDSCSRACSSSSSRSSPARRRCKGISGSIAPERVAIGTPSSGLYPIVVSTDRPSCTAVTEQPPPRWQTTRRGTRTPVPHAVGDPDDIVRCPCDRIDFLRRTVGGDNAELQARRARVDDENTVIVPSLHANPGV